MILAYRSFTYHSCCKWSKYQLLVTTQYLLQYDNQLGHVIPSRVGSFLQVKRVGSWRRPVGRRHGIVSTLNGPQSYTITRSTHSRPHASLLPRDGVKLISVFLRHHNITQSMRVTKHLIIMSHKQLPAQLFLRTQNSLTPLLKLNMSSIFYIKKLTFMCYELHICAAYDNKHCIHSMFIISQYRKVIGQEFLLKICTLVLDQNSLT